MVYLSKKDTDKILKELSKSSNKEIKRIIKEIKSPEEKIVYIRGLPQIKKLLKRAFKERRKVKMRYYSYHSDENTTRIIDIYDIHQDCIIAYCHLRKDERVFRIDRINSVAILDEKYSIPKGWEPENIILDK